MKFIGRSRTALQFALFLTFTAARTSEAQEAAGAAPDSALQAVEVTATRDPVGKSYRKMLRGMDLFEKRHGMAPNAALRYKLLPRQNGVRMDGIVVQVVGDSIEIPVTLAPDRTFTLEHNQKALDDDASVLLNRKASSMTWRTEIRTPGLPPDTRRLGDLRLECHVGMEAELVSNMIPVISLIRNFIDKMANYCDATVPHYYFFAARPLFSVTISAGARREVLSVDELYAGASYDPLSKYDLSYCDCQVLLDRTFYMPLGDKGWPDDTLIEFEYMDDGNAAAVAGDAIAIGRSTKADVIAALGKTAIIGFDSGYEVWAYQVTGGTPGSVRPFGRGGSERRASDRTELVILFAPSGIVAKTRIRPPPSRTQSGL